MNRISSYEEGKILEAWFEGVSRDEIAARVNVSGSTVSSVVSSLPTCLTPLRDLSKVLRRLNIGPVDALDGLAVREALSKLKVTVEQIPDFINGYKKIASSSDTEPHELVQARVKLAMLERQVGKCFPEAIDDFERLNVSHAKLEKENRELEVAIAENKKRRAQTLKLAESSPKEAAWIARIKAEFRKYGVILTDVEALRIFIINMKQSGYNPTQFFTVTIKYDTLCDMNSNLMGQIRLAQGNLSMLKPLVRQKESEMNRLSTEVDNLSRQASSFGHVLDSYCGELGKLQYDCAELHRYREGLIAQIGKMLGLTELEILNLQIEMQFELIKAVFDSKLHEMYDKNFQHLNNAFRTYIRS